MVLINRVAFAALLASVAGVAAAQTLVVRSSGPSAAAYPPGQIMAADKPVMLRAGDEVVVLDSKGTRTLKGPGSFRANAPTAVDAGRWATVASQVSASRGRRARIGAVRGTAPATAPSLWAVDIAKNTTTCVPDARRVTLWRADGSTELRAMLTRASDGKSTAVVFPAGSAAQPWPAAMPPAAGESYTLAAGPTETMLRVAPLGTMPSSQDALAKAFADNKCDAQAGLLLDAARRGAAAAATPEG